MRLPALRNDQLSLLVADAADIYHDGNDNEEARRYVEPTDYDDDIEHKTTKKAHQTTKKNKKLERILCIMSPCCL